MRVFLLQPRFVIVLIAGVMHQVQFIHQSAGLKQLQRSVYGNAIQLRIHLLCELEKPLSIQMLTGLVNQIEQDLALAG
jgi:hypothetical protein